MIHTVLIIDDEEDLLEPLQERLQTAGYHIQAALGGAEGLRLARQSPPDLVVCDVNMSEVDGFAVLSALRADELTSEIPFIFLTGRNKPEEIRQGMRLGVEDYLCKPVAIGELVAVIETRIAKRLRQKAREQEQMNRWAGGLSRILSHELRTPLCAIVPIPDLLEASREGDMSVGTRLACKSLRYGAKRLMKVVERLLLYSEVGFWLATNRRGRITRGTQDVAASLCRRARALAQEWLRPDDLDLKVAAADLTAGEEHLEYLALELIDNACKFSLTGTAVAVEFSTTATALTLRVTDHGRGLTDPQIKSIMAFRQFDREFYEQQGLGLGLALVQLLALYYGGECRLQSQPGEETTVTVTLPISRNESPKELPATPLSRQG